MKILFFISAVFLSSYSFSQNASSYASNVFVELGGNSGVISLNYDQRFSPGNSGLGARAGIGVGAIPSHMFINTVLTVPVGINYLLGKGSHHLEAGAGVTIGEAKFSADGSYRISSTFFVPSLGYRYQPPRKGVTLRVFASPFIASVSQFWAGLSLGARF